MAAPGRIIGGRITAGKGALALGVHITPSPILVARDIQNYGNGIRSFREPLNRAIREVMIPSIRANFDEEGRPSWEPLSEYTLNLRREEGTGSKILDRTGRLKRVATQINIWRIEGGYRAKEGRAVVTDLPGAEYGEVHQQGSRGQIFRRLPPGVREAISSRNLGGRGDIPARPFLQFHPSDRAKVEKIFTDWHDERARRYLKLRPGR